MTHYRLTGIDFFVFMYFAVSTCVLEFMQHVMESIVIAKVLEPSVVNVVIPQELAATQLC